MQPRNPMASLPKVKLSLLSMSWVEYVEEIVESKNHNVKNHDVNVSLKLLRIAQQWFVSERSFSALSLGRRQAIAGLVVDRRREPIPTSRGTGDGLAQ